MSMNFSGKTRRVSQLPVITFPRFSKMSSAHFDELDDTEDTWLQGNVTRKGLEKQ